MFADADRRTELLAESVARGMFLIDGAQSESSIKRYPDLDTCRLGHTRLLWPHRGNSHLL